MNIIKFRTPIIYYYHKQDNDTSLHLLPHTTGYTHHMNPYKHSLENNTSFLILSIPLEMPDKIPSKHLISSCNFKSPIKYY